jgi:Family of unknown function (DUF6920)
MSGRRFPPSEATRSFPGTEPRVPLLERRSRWRLLVGLPLPVQRYFRTALKDGQAAIAAVTLEQVGQLDIGETSTRWQTFRSTQRVVIRRPGSTGMLASLCGPAYRFGCAMRMSEDKVSCTPHSRGAGEVAEGELMRFLAEAAWYPTALLPSPDLSWTALGGRSARATLVDGPNAVSLQFDFDAQGLIATVSAEARGRTVGGKTVPTPWTGRFWNYADREGLRVPLEAEVSWLTPESPRPYWRGRITALRFEWAR